MGMSRSWMRSSLLAGAVEVSVAAAAFASSSSSSSSPPSSPSPSFASSASFFHNPSSSSLPTYHLSFNAVSGYSLAQTFRYPLSSASSFRFCSSRPQARSSVVGCGAVASELAAATMGVSTEEAVQEHSGVDQNFQTEFMVDMKCEGCENAVRSKLEGLEGVSSVEVDLPNQVVRIFGSSTIKALTEALEKTGRKARLIGQGKKEDFAISAAVAEFKGPQVHGVVRFAQVSMEKVRVEASFSGLSPGFHGWSVNEYGDLTRGAASTGPIFHPKGVIAAEPLGDLGTLEVDNTSSGHYVGMKDFFKVGDLIGRAVVVYESQDKEKPGIAAAVIARSAGVGENYKKLCTCDGTIIWEATNSDFAKL